METLSPGVYSRELDYTIQVPKSSTSIGAFAGKFDKGRAGEPVLVTTIEELVNNFGTPTNENFNDWFQAKTFLDYGNKLYISRAVDENGTWKRSDAVIATAITEPAVGQAGVNKIDVTYDKADIVAGSWIRFVIDGNQRRYFVTKVEEQAGASKMTKELVFKTGTNENGGATFPLSGAEDWKFTVTIDGKSFTHTALLGSTRDDVLNGLDAAFANAGINNVNFNVDLAAGKVIIESLTSGADGAFNVTFVEENGYMPVAVNDITQASSGIATLTLDMEIDWDLIQGEPGSKLIPTGAGQIDYVYSIATNALGEVRADKGDYKKQKTTLVMAEFSGTQVVGTPLKATFVDYLGNSTVVETQVEAETEGGTTPESKSSYTQKFFNKILEKGIKGIDFTVDTVAGKIYAVSKYAGTKYAFGVTSDGGMQVLTPSSDAAKDGTPKLTSAETFATRGIFYNKEDFEYKESTIRFSANDSKLKFIARWVGDTGNNVDVTIAKKGDFNKEAVKDTVVDVTAAGVRTVTTTETSPVLAVNGITLDSLFDYVPSDDEVAIVISERGEIKETYIVSLDKTKKDYNGRSKYIEDVINLKSDYVFVKDNEDVTGMPESTVFNVIKTTTEQYQVSTGQKIGKNVTEVQVGELLNLEHGDSGVVQRDDYERAWSLFEDKEIIEVDILIANESSHKFVAELAKKRGECIAIIGAKYEHTVGLKTSKAIDNMVDYVMSIYGDLNIENSYAGFFGNYTKIYDRWNATSRWINVAGAAAGLRAKLDFPWYASAGLNAGQILGVDKLALTPNKGQRDILYINKINPITSFQGAGNAVVFGNKTMLSRPSSLDRLNVRGLFNVLKRSISKMSKYYLFEINDEFTRKRFVESVTPFMEQVKADRGIYDFYIQCDERNNTPYVIDANQFKATIAFKPARIAEFIILDFVAVSTGVDFEEIFE